MGARGKKSSAALSVVAPSGITAIDRPQPPEYLTTEQANEWAKVTNRMPADWFPDETHATLEQYCCHAVQFRYISQMIEALLGEEQKDGWLMDYDRLLKMQEREGRATTACARAMRLTQQTSYSKDRGKGSSVKKPHLM